MNALQSYIRKNGGALLTTPPAPGLGLVVAIPAYAEPNLLLSLESLRQCALPASPVEVLVLINHPENADEEEQAFNQNTYEKSLQWAAAHSTSQMAFHIAGPLAMPAKHAGAGLARKLLMDEAVRRFVAAGSQEGIIAAFDADSTCTPNYLTELEIFFEHHPKHLACSIHFEHPFDDERHPIVQYELHLRYMKHALAFAGHPYANYTVGSSMAVRASAYAKQGGMNRRKAGEDFYFLQKMMMAGEVGYLSEATVFPSARTSHRVPFGTGRAMLEMQQDRDVYLTYHPESYRQLAKLLSGLERVWQGGTHDVDNTCVKRFLDAWEWERYIAEIKVNTSSYTAFKKRFFRWFNAFTVMKYLHFMRDCGYPDIPVTEAVSELLKMEPDSTTELLYKLRSKDKKAG